MELARAAREAGVVGAGGAGFPTEVKVRARADTVIANGAECEPLLVTDQRVLIHHAEEVLAGLRAVGESVGARRIVLALKEHYHEAIEAARPFLDGPPPVELARVGDFYPAGDEQVLVREVTGRVVPEGGIPPEVGVVVQNITTLWNLHRALQGLPVTHRTLTVTGVVARPGVYHVPLGTLASDVLAMAGGATRPDIAVIDGGPMMGFLLPDLDHPVTKTTSALLVLPADSAWIEARRRPLAMDLRRAAAICCQCRMCTDLCPRWLLGHRLQPHLAMRAALAGGPVPDAVEAMGFLCSQCGVCEVHACPLGLSPRRVLGEFRGQQAARGRRNPFRDRPDAPREAQAWARVPKPRLVQRLGLDDWKIAATGPITEVRDPWEVRIPLRQHVGAPARPVVRPGQRVHRGDLIAEAPSEGLGARVHASVSGVVRVVQDRFIQIEQEAP
ncbi:MAG TPA: SLBB domain-containing protein [Myxococcota bacterium]|nr:SLBB domain-containing protein [Myxococcota bacterium]HQK49957.1 SLBB domain-containing protein [Myxococcota bacterium]